MGNFIIRAIIRSAACNEAPGIEIQSQGRDTGTGSEKAPSVSIGGTQSGTQSANGKQPVPNPTTAVPPKDNGPTDDDFAFLNEGMTHSIKYFSTDCLRY